MLFLGDFSQLTNQILFLAKDTYIHLNKEASIIKAPYENYHIITYVGKC